VCQRRAAAYPRARQKALPHRKDEGSARGTTWFRRSARPTSPGPITLTQRYRAAPGMPYPRHAAASSIRLTSHVRGAHPKGARTRWPPLAGGSVPSTPLVRSRQYRLSALLYDLLQRPVKRTTQPFDQCSFASGIMPTMHDRFRWWRRTAVGANTALRLRVSNLVPIILTRDSARASGRELARATPAAPGYPLSSSYLTPWILAPPSPGAFWPRVWPDVQVHILPIGQFRISATCVHCSCAMKRDTEGRRSRSRR
jgi:hypothetical protein